MGTNTVEVVNHKLLGDMVKAWARGTAPCPKTLQQFVRELTQAGVGIKIPAGVTQLRFVQDELDTLTVRLPCKMLLEETEEDLGSTRGSYPLPAFYEQLFAAKPKDCDALAIQSARIGEYSIAQCA